MFCQGEIQLTDAATAEMSKLVENSYRDVNIAFANELSVISEKLDIDVWELIRWPTITPGSTSSSPAPASAATASPWIPGSSSPPHRRVALIRTAREVNDGKPRWVLDQVRDAFAGLPRNAEIAVLGLAFKANIDDLRESRH